MEAKTMSNNHKDIMKMLKNSTVFLLSIVPPTSGSVWGCLAEAAAQSSGHFHKSEKS